MRKILFAASAFFLAQCAVYKPDYSQASEASDYKLPGEAPSYTLFLVGDAGKPDSEIGQQVLPMLHGKLKGTEGSKGVIFLGDNIYPSGMPSSKSKKKYEKAASRLNAQVDTVKNLSADVYFISGNHDWISGLKGVKEQERLIKKGLGTDALLPAAGCGGPEIVKVNDQVVFLLIDSQWWMEDWSEHKDMNEGCVIKNKNQYIDAIYNAIKKYQEKTLIVAMHHPLFSAGPHGGNYALKQHLFPFTDLNENLYIPFPFVGTFLRRHIGLRQDIEYPAYLDLKRRILKKAEGFNHLVFVSGHEHNLQYIIDEGHPFIVSGAGSKKSPAKAGGPAKFTNGQGGFVEMRFYKDGSSYALYWNSSSGKMDYAVQVRPPRAPMGEFDFELYNSDKDSVEMSIYPSEQYPGWFQRKMWGELHREKYYVPVKVPVLRLDSVYGGLRPVQKGGGNQTNSIRLSNAEGKQYVLRSMRKDANRIMGGVLKGTFVVDVMKDVFTFSHPFAAFVMPVLGDAAGIYHTNPKLVYLPKQPLLGNYNESFGNGLYLFEERPAGDRSDVASFGRSTKIISTPDLIAKIEKNPTHKVDAAFVLKSRLFDMMVGDWDRHSDQWRWASFQKDDHKTYRPIPRDRDQPFSKFNGFLPQVVNKTIPLARQFQSFGPDIKRIKWYNNYARFFDRRFLASLEWEEWEKQVSLIQSGVTDAEIEKAIGQLPKGVFDIDGAETIENIKKRRDVLKDIARRYYLLLASEVDVVGTNKADVFEIERLDEDRTSVKIFTEHHDKKWLVYERIFHRSETDEVRCYGLDGKDEFQVKGDVSKGIVVRIIGGHDKDRVYDQSKVSGLAKKTKVYDALGGVVIEGSSETADRTSSNYTLSNYDFKDLQRNHWLIWPLLSANPDFGFAFGASWLYNGYSFKKFPNAVSHRIKAFYASGSDGSFVGYDGVFPMAIGKLDLIAGASWQAPRYTINFFGMGNESMSAEGIPRSFNQVRQEKWRLSTGLRYRWTYSGYIELEPFYESIAVEETEDRFISLANDANLVNPEVFVHNSFAGATMRFIYDSRDVRASPTRGLFLNGFGQYNRSVGGNDLEIKNGSIGLTLSAYQRVVPNGRLVWATQIGVQNIIGDFLFYQSAYVGGTSSLRGFREFRFRGRTAFSNSNDLRWNLGALRNRIVPTNFGLFGSFDHGRVWLDEETFDGWHYSYGGGVFFNILDMASITAGYHIGNEEGQFLFNLGYNF